MWKRTETRGAAFHRDESPRQSAAVHVAPILPTQTIRAMESVLCHVDMLYLFDARKKKKGRLSGEASKTIHLSLSHAL